MDEYSAIKSNGPLTNIKKGCMSKIYFEQKKPVTKVYKLHESLYKNFRAGSAQSCGDWHHSSGWVGDSLTGGEHSGTFYGDRIVLYYD